MSVGSVFDASVAGFRTWTRCVDLAGGGRLAGRIGAGDVTVRTFAHDVPVTPDLGWELCVGSGARALIDGLDDAAVARIRTQYDANLATDTLPSAP